jgi:hypothetical protein
MTTKYTKWPKFTQIGIFGLKTNHLATLLRIPKIAEENATFKH